LGRSFFIFKKPLLRRGRSKHWIVATACLVAYWAKSHPSQIVESAGSRRH